MPIPLKNPMLSIITVTYLSEKDIVNLVSSVSQFFKNIDYEHIIVDNGSNDKTKAILHSLNGSVEPILLKENIGFSAANLIGYKKAKGDFLLFLNPDMQFDENENRDNMSSLLKKLLLRKDIGIVGCKLQGYDGCQNLNALPRRFPKLSDQFAILLKLDKLFPKLLDSYLYKDYDFNKEQFVDSVRGSFMLMPRNFIETIGFPFDVRYFIWFEDVDICKEAWKNGFKVLYTPAVYCKDGVGQSFKQQKRAWRFRQYARSLFIYFKKWESLSISIFAFLFFIPLSYLIGLSLVGKLSNIFKKR